MTVTELIEKLKECDPEAIAITSTDLAYEDGSLQQITTVLEDSEDSVFNNKPTVWIQ